MTCSTPPPRPWAVFFTLLLFLGASLVCRAQDSAPSSPESPDWAKVAESYAENGSPDALAPLANELGENPENAAQETILSCLEGLQALQEKEYAIAAAAFQKTIELQPGWRRIWIHLIECERQLEDRAAFLDVTDRFLATFADDEARLLCGRTWMQLRDWERLQPLRAHFAEHPPVSPEELAVPSGEDIAQQPFASLINLDLLLKTQPENLQIRFAMGDLLCRYGRPSEGLAHFERIASAEPDNLRIVVFVARAAKLANEPEKGIAAVETANRLLAANDSLSEAARTHLRSELDRLLVAFLDMQDAP